MSRIRLIVLVALVAGPALRPVWSQTRLRTYASRYYILHTDLPRDAVREAELRITAMAEMYHARTRSFAGRITSKLPFYLYSRPADYYAAGGVRGSAGLFDGRRLMAIAGSQTTGSTWHVIQHEGFHQFVHAVIGGDIPVWVNEGLAEYFGEAIFTGDGFVTGIVPPPRLARLQGLIRQRRTRSIERMMRTTYDDWNAGLSVVNYDQAWSMVHFLAHGDGGRYQKAFNNFIRDVSHGMRWPASWKKNFGTGTRAFEQKWRRYWLDLPADPTADRYAQATAATLTSFLGRAAAQRQTFASFEEFRTKAAAGRLMIAPRDWLPPALLADALKRVDTAGTWELRRRAGRWQLLCHMDDDTTLLGTFKLNKRRLVRDSVQVKFIRKARRRR